MSGTSPSSSTPPAASERTRERLAAGLWLAAALFYVGSELAAATAFSPRYSYARNYISDLGVTVGGTIFEGRPICSPLHGLMNADFIVQALLFPGAALAISRSIPSPGRFAFVAVAALNGLGNGLIGTFPEIMPGRLGATLSCHVVGALLAIVCGNGAALMSASLFGNLELPRIHRRASLVLPIAAFVSLAMLIGARSSGTRNAVPDAVWDRISVYAITAWEVLSATCLMARARRR